MMKNSAQSTIHGLQHCFQSNGLFLLFSVIFVLVVFYDRALNFSDFMDAADYLAAGISILEKGAFFPTRIPYSDFMNLGIENIQTGLVNYPNYAFEITVGAISLLRGDVSLVNGMLVALFFAALFSIAYYLLCVRLLRSNLLAFLCVILAVGNHITAVSLGRPLTESSFLFFTTVAAFAAVSDKPFLTGALLGIGYLFREQAVLMLPLFPLLFPSSVTVKNFIRLCLFACVAFLPFFLVAQWLSNALSAGTVTNSLYYAAFVAPLLKDLSFSFLASIVKVSLRSAWLYAQELGAVFLAPLFILCTFYRKLAFLPRRLLLVSLLIIVQIIFIFALVSRSSVPARYLSFAIPFICLAFALTCRQYKNGIVIFGLITALSLVQHPPVKNIFSPMTFSRAVAIMDLPNTLRAEFHDGDIILTNFIGFTFLAVQEPVAVRLPQYQVFYEQSGNDLFAGIMYYHHPAKTLGWPDDDIIQDAHGVVFERIGKEYHDIPYRFYKKIADY